MRTVIVRSYFFLILWIFVFSPLSHLLMTSHNIVVITNSISWYLSHRTSKEKNEHQPPKDTHCLLGKERISLFSVVLGMVVSYQVEAWLCYCFFLFKFFFFYSSSMKELGSAGSFHWVSWTLALIHLWWFQMVSGPLSVLEWKCPSSFWKLLSEHFMKLLFW